MTEGNRQCPNCDAELDYLEVSYTANMNGSWNVNENYVEDSDECDGDDYEFKCPQCGHEENSHDDFPEYEEDEEEEDEEEEEIARELSYRNEYFSVNILKDDIFIHDLETGNIVEHEVKDIDSILLADSICDSSDEIIFGDKKDKLKELLEKANNDL